MYIKRHRVNIEYTALNQASQAFYSPYLENGGLIRSIVYNRAAASALATGAKLVLTAELSSAPILTVASATADTMVFYPCAGAQNTSGAALGYTSAATPPAIPVFIPVGQERIKVEVTSGGASAAADSAKAYLDLYISGA